MKRGWVPEDDLAAEIMERGRMEGEYHEADKRETTSNDPSPEGAGEADHERVQSSRSGGRRVHQGVDQGVHGAPGQDDKVEVCHCEASNAKLGHIHGMDGSVLCFHEVGEDGHNCPQAFYEEDFRQQNELGLL